MLRFREAQDRADVETQRALLSADSRIWYEKKEGAGEKREPDAGGGSWSDWDRFFRSENTVGIQVSHAPLRIVYQFRHSGARADSIALSVA